jgi:aromatic-L-amino-acid/L-tryptophan decarboxylase
MDHADLNHWSKWAADWAARYHAALRDRPVRAPLVPGTVAAQLPTTAPDRAETIDTILADFEAIVPGASTRVSLPIFRRTPHQHPCWPNS